METGTTRREAIALCRSLLQQSGKGDHSVQLDANQRLLCEFIVCHANPFSPYVEGDLVCPAGTGRSQADTIVHLMLAIEYRSVPELGRAFPFVRLVQIEILDDDLRGKGVGTALLDALESLCVVHLNRSVVIECVLNQRWRANRFERRRYVDDRSPLGSCYRVYSHAGSSTYHLLAPPVLSQLGK